MPCTRRTFLTAASGLVVAGRPASGTVQGANDRIRIGVIGTGGRARGLMTLLKKLPGNDMVAVCDVYEPRLLQAAEIAGTTAAKVVDYRRILDDRQVDAVVIGTPDHWHKTITLDAVAAGKDVYVEKPVSHGIAEGAEMVSAIEASKQIVQTGTQQRSWDHWLLGKQIVDSGRLGRITMVHTYWYQHATAGNYPPVSLEFRGDRGTLKIDRARLVVYRDDAAWASGTLTPEPDIYVRSSGDGTLTHLQNWLDCIRSRKAPNAHPRSASGRTDRPYRQRGLASRAPGALECGGREDPEVTDFFNGRPWSGNRDCPPSPFQHRWARVARALRRRIRSPRLLPPWPETPASGRGTTSVRALQL